MVLSRGFLTAPLALGLLIGGFVDGVAQRLPAARDGSTLGYSRIRWPLVDFVIHGDSVRGVLVYAAPNLASQQGTDEVGGTIEVVRVDPIEARQWVTLMQRLVRADAPSLPVDSLIPPVLRDLDTTGFIALGLEPHPGDHRRYFLEVALPRRPWRVAATAAEVNALLEVLTTVAEGSAVRARTEGGDTILFISTVTQRPEMLSHPRLMYPATELRDGVEGRVWLQFAVDTLGRPEMDSVRVVLSDSKGFAREAVRSMQGARFRPARFEGRAVRVLVMIPLNFRLHP
jgi:TonB family protein